MKVVSVINCKGGVGKTTITANLGAYIASKPKRVLLIDLDPQAHLTFNFIDIGEWSKRYAENKTIRDCFKSFTRGESDYLAPLSKFIITARAGDHKVDIITSHLDLLSTETELNAMINVMNDTIRAASFLKLHCLLRNALAELRNNYDLVLFDCPPNFNVLVKNAIVASDYYIVPAKLDYLSSVLGVESLQQNINKFVELYEMHRNFLKSNKYSPVLINMLGIVPMMVNFWRNDTLINTQEDFIKELEQKNYYIFQPIRNNSTVFGSGPQVGFPVVLTKPKIFQKTQRAIVKELEDLGDEFLKRIKI